MFARGGVVIDTGTGVALRTVIQPDGDMLCFIDKSRTSGDDILWRAHAEAVRSFFRRSDSALDVVERAYRLLTVALTVAAAALFTTFLGWLTAAFIGAAVAWVAANVRRLERQAQQVRRRAAQLTLRLLAVVLPAGTALALVALGRVGDALSFLGATVSWLLLNWGAHWAVRRFLGRGGWVS
jgi:hypothetical protein